MHQQRSTNRRRRAIGAAAALVAATCAIAVIAAARRHSPSSSSSSSSFETSTAAAAPSFPSVRGGAGREDRSGGRRRRKLEECPKQGQCLDPESGRCVDLAACFADPCEAGPCGDEEVCAADYCGGCRYNCSAAPAADPVPADGEDPTTESTQPAKWWPRGTSWDGTRECVYGADYPETYPYLKILILFDTREQCCDVYRCAVVDANARDATSDGPRDAAAGPEGHRVVPETRGGSPHCAENSKKKCKQADGCQWDSVVELCMYALPGTTEGATDPADLPCPLKSEKQCKKDPGCELWGPNLDTCIYTVGVPVPLSGGGDSCAGKKQNPCKKDRKCKWKKAEEKCMVKKSNQGKVDFQPRSDPQPENVEPQIKAAPPAPAEETVPDPIPNVHEGSCSDDGHCEGDLVCHVASGECTCSIATNAGCPPGQSCGIHPGACFDSMTGCLPMCTCDSGSDSTDGSNGCPLGQVCREPCAMADSGPRCFESNEKRDCGVFDVEGSEYVCRDTNGDGVIDKDDGGTGCVDAMPQVKPVPEGTLDELLNEIDPMPLPSEVTTLPFEGAVMEESSQTIPQSVNAPMVLMSDPAPTFPVLETIAEAAPSPEVFPVSDAAATPTSDGEEHWYPQLVDGVGLCVHGSDYPALYTLDDLSRETSLFESYPDCCAAFPEGCDEEGGA